MSNKQLVECVPNFSEGRDMTIIDQIVDAAVKAGATLLNVDPGKATNRTVVTFVGEPKTMVNACFEAIKKASQLIDMSKHKGEHPRSGATDVCPFIPISNVTMEECAECCRQLGKRVGEELGISVYLYENAASSPQRQNLAVNRKGEYEGMKAKLKDPQWKPDFGPTELNVTAGVTNIGARDFLVAYNVNLNTNSTRRANAIAFDVRENGRPKRIGDPITGEVVKDEKGEIVRIPGALQCCKAIGWYIDEYEVAQVSMNLTNISVTSVHRAFEECCKSALERGLRVTGSEIVGLIPLKVLVEAGKYFLQKQNLSRGASEKELVHIAIKSLGLDDLAPFDPRTRVIEYMLEDIQNKDVKKLVDMNLKDFANLTASDAPAPGGGSIAAYAGCLGAALAAMVGNLSAHKRGWDNRVDEFSLIAEQGQALKERLCFLVDADTDAFNKVMEAMKSKGPTRDAAILEASKEATNIPLEVMKTCAKIMPLAKQMLETGLATAKSDAGVASLAARCGCEGAFYNVYVNLPGISDKDWAKTTAQEAKSILEEVRRAEAEIQQILMKKLESELDF
eukprot:GCRY01000653.1.p1 GENE.GCRY01000653.1~~GCRY01000653.1.p1  ORF type:complete len:565 (-),score=116.25 GCRY01000653.1:54-1748(-)